LPQPLERGARIAEALLAIVFALRELRVEGALQIGRHGLPEDLLVGRHAVENDAAHAIRMTHEVLLRHARSVRHTDEIELRRTERLPQRFEIFDEVGGGVCARIAVFTHRVETALRLRTHAIEIDAGRVDLGAVVFALERMRATGAALVDEQRVPMLEQLRKCIGDAGECLRRSLSRPTREEHEEIRLGCFLIRAQQLHAQVEHAALRIVATLGHFERRAERLRGVLLIFGAAREAQRAQHHGVGIVLHDERRLLGTAMLERTRSERADHRQACDHAQDVAPAHRSLILQ
jgi:hypothetical protein